MRITTGSRRSPFRGRKTATSARAIGAVIAVSALALTSACTIGNNSTNADSSQAANSSNGDREQKSKAHLKSNFKDGATSADITKPVEVTADEKIDSVSLVNPEGVEVKGTFNDDHTKWTASEKLGFGRTYTLEAKSGSEKLNETFTTVTPDYTLGYSLSPMDGSTVGVGQTIAIRFEGVPTDRKAIEKAISIETDPHVEGAFYWITNQEVRWRPEHFWKPGTKVSVKVDLYGVDLGDGAYGDADMSAKFTIGDETRAVVDDNTKTMTVYHNGEVIKTMPVSLGRDDQYPTPNGIYMIGDQHQSIVMDSRTYGLPLEAGGYKQDVAYATQMSYSGIYIHSAPWSVWAQGNTNTSHGCVNVSPENALWVLNNMGRGDIVEVKNTTGGTLNGADGLGDWNIPWSTWKGGNDNS